MRYTVLQLVTDYPGLKVKATQPTKTIYEKQRRKTCPLKAEQYMTHQEIMVKPHRKKRRHDEMIPALQLQRPTTNSYGVAHVQVNDGEDSIDNILAEMAGQQGINLSSSLIDNQPTTATTIKALPTLTCATIPADTMPSTTYENDHSCTINLYNQTIPTQQYTKQQRERIRLWNLTMNSWQKSGVYNNIDNNIVTSQQFVPSFDIEMTRHFKVQAISSFVLDACKGLKMPAFERWYVILVNA
jgi:hypothetical protein